jgi:hypothetical protein
MKEVRYRGLAHIIQTLIRKLNGRDYFGGLGIDRIILKWILKIIRVWGCELDSSDSDK